MQDGLQNFINSKKQEGSLTRQGEEATKQGFILPMLHHLGWNPFDVQEVFPEYTIQSGRVDYSLRINNLNKVFIEVKKISEDLEKHQEQLLRYAFHHGVKLAILTNGIIWWFYLPLHEGSWEQRRFYTIDIQSQSTIDIVEKLTSFLSRQEVADGKAIKNAENIYNSRQKGEIINQALPKAWRKLLSERDDFLAEIIAESVEKICGYKPENEIVINFLKKFPEKQPWFLFLNKQNQLRYPVHFPIQTANLKKVLKVNHWCPSQHLIIKNRHTLSLMDCITQ